MGKGGKLSSMDKQFLHFIKDYQSKLDFNSPHYAILKWDCDEIIAHVQRMDLSYRRKPERNLRNSCEIGK